MSTKLDRAAGALVGLAVGDALGAGYEFTNPDPDAPIDMIGGGLGGFAPGEWTDDTDQAVAIARVTARGSVDPVAIGRGFLDWLADGPADVGVSTSHVLRAARGDPAALPQAAAHYFATNPRGAAGNGALMRTAPVAQAHLGDDEAIADAARTVAAITHGDPLAGEACVLWCIAIDRAVREQRLDGVRDGLALLSPDRAAFWEARLDEAETRPPATFNPNGFVVTALQAAHAAIHQTPVPTDRPGRHFAHAVEAAVRVGDDTDTVAAIAGQLLGARWGLSAIPSQWRLMLHGWPGMDDRDLVSLAVRTALGGNDDAIGWPSIPSLVDWGRAREPEPVCVPLPGDDAVLAGNLPGLPVALADGVDAVVSLCRVGSEDVPEAVDHLAVWLSDTDGPGDNPNLALVVEDTVDQIRRWRGAGKRVYVHCVGAHSRTPLIAAAYLAAINGADPLAERDGLRAVLSLSDHNGAFLRHLGNMAESQTR